MRAPRWTTRTTLGERAAYIRMLISESEYDLVQRAIREGDTEEADWRQVFDCALREGLTDLEARLHLDIVDDDEQEDETEDEV